jgi:hypothetical protein
MDLTTLTKVKALMELEETDWDSLLSDLIGSVSERCASYCNRDFESKSRVEYHDGGGQYLYLKGLPVESITSVYGSDTWEWATSNLIPSTDYQLLTAGMLGYRYGVWSYGPKALKVTYVGGYDPFYGVGSTSPDDEDEDPLTIYTPIPDDLEMAVRSQVAYDFNRRKDIGLESISFPDGSIQKVTSGEFLPSVKAVLNRYRIRPS